ncbi:NucA/NucB deoxyribonuclease domain-containing protein [Phytohabitans rumicis]|uniref:NucA/NucB deoxyribonuclease domain-containing protein n=1 Tax=Phytohabitans rumicis TaxID=1076125 RepID=UPI0031EDF68B
MRASRSVAAAIVAAVVLLAPASPAAAAPAEKQSYTRLTVTTPEGKALPKTPRAPKSDKEKRRITPETPQRAKLRTDYLATLEDRVQATDFVNMTECWGAFGAGLGGQVTLNHFTWCSLGYLTIEDVLCSNGSCKVQGSIVFRLSVQGMGHQGSHSTDDRKTRVWVLLDEPVVTGAPRMDRRLKLNGTCSSSTAGTSCDVTEDGDTATLTQWMLAGSTYFTFVLPAGNVDGADRIAYGDFMIKANILDNPIGYESWIMGPESGFRCDSSSKVSYYGCVYPDVIEQFWLKATPDVAQEAAHVWRAQNQPNTTLPLPMAGKSIPGSRNSGSPLERLTDETTKKANNDKSRRFCQRYWGRGYSQNNTKQCDEYPFQSTWQGSSIGGDGTSHFSVDVIDTSHNRVGGEHLNKFYNERRIIEQDKFYVDVLTADGKPYGRTDAFPTGPITPIEYPQCENSALPEIEEVETKAAPQDLFNNYAENTPDGWTGGDSTYSVTLPDGRRLWIFSDTFLGPLNSDGTRPTSAGFVNSTFVIQNGDSLTTITGGTKAAPTAIMPPAAENHWYWAGDGMLANVGGEQKLQVMYYEYRRFGLGAWDWEFNRNVVATFSLDDLTEPERVDQLPSAARVAWGSALLEASRSGDGYTYIYGVSDAPINKKMRVARVKGSDLSKVEDWQFFDTAEGYWVRDERDGTTSLTGIANEYSVTPWNGGFVLISQDSTEAFSGKIRIWHSCSPYGPFGYWVDHDLVYRMPEPGPYGSYWDGDIIGYNAHVHPGLRVGDRWTLSYNVNSMDSRVSAEGDHYRDPSIYRPRFVSFRIVPK